MSVVGSRSPECATRSQESQRWETGLLLSPRLAPIPTCLSDNAIFVHQPQWLTTSYFSNGEVIPALWGHWLWWGPQEMVHWVTTELLPKGFSKDHFDGAVCSFVLTVRLFLRTQSPPGPVQVLTLTQPPLQIPPSDKSSCLLVL